MNVTAEPTEAKVAADAVSHDPAIEIVEVANRRTAGPTAVRLPRNPRVAAVSVRMPDQARFEATVIATPAFTVRFATGWGMLTDPPEAFTTTVDVPAMNTPADVSIDLAVIVLPFAISDPPLPTDTVVAVTAKFEPDVVSVPTTESVPPMSIALVSAIVPETTRLLKPLAESNVLTVFVAPESVTVPVPFVNVEPAPEVSQLPLTTHVPAVRVRVADAPLVMVTSTTVTADPLAARVPEFPMNSEPPAMAKFAGASAVVEPAVSWMVRTLPQRSAFAAIVNVTMPLLAVDCRVTL